MTTLRAKLAVLIAAVIISSIGIITGVLIYILKLPDQRQGIGAMADQSSCWSK